LHGVVLQKTPEMQKAFRPIVAEELFGRRLVIAAPGQIN
jgi:hypothetical protein